jgi:hypothetical protein
MLDISSILEFPSANTTHIGKKVTDLLANEFGGEVKWIKG